MDKVVYIGMDLGTFKTSVASSAGVRDVIQTAVGWPKDHISRAMLGRDVVFGKDLVEHRLALNVVRPFEKGMLKYTHEDGEGIDADHLDRCREAARLVVKHAVGLTRPAAGLPVYGIIGAPSRASLANKRVIVEAARDTFDGVMVVPEPFTIAYGMNRLSDTLVIDIGAGTTDICPIYGTFPTAEEQMTIPYGGDMIDAEFERLLRRAYPQVQISTGMAREIKERHGFVHDVNEAAEVSLPIAGKPHLFDVTGPLKEACRSLVRPIVEAVGSMIATFDPEFQPRMLGNILLGGGGSQLKGLDTVLEQGLRDYGAVKVKRVYDPVFAGAVGALKLAMGMPRDYFEGLARGAEPAAAAA